MAGVAYKKSDLTFKDLSFTGFFSNGSKKPDRNKHAVNKRF